MTADQTPATHTSAADVSNGGTDTQATPAADSEPCSVCRRADGSHKMSCRPENRDAATDSERDERPTYEEVMGAYQAHRNAGRAMHAALLDIWRMAEPGDTKHMTYRDPSDVVMSVRALLAEQAATIERVIDRGLIQPAEWLGDKRTYSDELAEEPGNDAYMAYIERVLTASGYTDIPWGPVTLAITLDRLVRENEKALALGSQRTEEQG